VTVNFGATFGSAFFVEVFDSHVLLEAASIVLFRSMLVVLILQFMVVDVEFDWCMLSNCIVCC
jgi:hypothetical protein